MGIHTMHDLFPIKWYGFSINEYLHPYNYRSSASFLIINKTQLSSVQWSHISSKNWIAINWKKLEIHTMDDLFHQMLWVFWSPCMLDSICQTFSTAWNYRNIQLHHFFFITRKPVTIRIKHRSRTLHENP